jgi:WD40 repeat protein
MKRIFSCILACFLSVACLQAQDIPGVVKLDVPPNQVRVDFGAGGEGGLPHFAAFSTDGKTVAVASGNDPIVRICDAATGKVVQKLEGHTKRVNYIAFLPGGKRIVTVTQRESVRIWDIETGSANFGKELHNLGNVTGFFQTKDDNPRLVSLFSPDGKKILTEGPNSTVQIWDIETGKVIQKLEGHARGGASAVFSPDGKKIISAGSDNTARIWDAETGKMLHTLTGERPVNSVAFSPDGKKVITGDDTGGRDVPTRIWNAETGERLHVLENHIHGVGFTVFAPDGKTVATAGHGNTARVWNVDTGAMVHELEYDGWLHSLEFSSDGKKIMVASNGDAWIWDTESGKELHKFESLSDSKSTGFGDSSGAITSAAFSPDGKRIVLTYANGIAYIVDLDRIPPPKERPAISDF